MAIDPDRIARAIPGSAGIIAEIARRAHCTRNTISSHLKKNPDLQRLYNDEVESLLDLAECKMIEAIQNGDAIMIRWYLSTKGKHRGYTEADKGPTRVENLNVIVVREMLPEPDSVPALPEPDIITVEAEEIDEGDPVESAYDAIYTVEERTEEDIAQDMADALQRFRDMNT